MTYTFSINGKRQQLNASLLSTLFFLLILGHLVVWISLFDWARFHIGSAIPAPFVLPILYLLRRKERAVYKIVFDDEQRICIIHYYLLLFIKVRRTLPYNNATFRYVPVRYLRGIYANAFQILNGTRLVVEIRQKYNTGWTKEEILSLDSYAKDHSLLNYDSEALKRIGGRLLPE